MGNKVSLYFDEKEAFDNNHKYIKKKIILYRGHYNMYELCIVYNGKITPCLDTIDVNDGSNKYRFVNGKLHNESEPSLITYKGNYIHWYKNGLLHRENGPAIIGYGRCYWYHEGLLNGYGLQPSIYYHGYIDKPHPSKEYHKKGKAYTLFQLQKYGKIIFRHLFKYYIKRRRIAVSKILQENGCIVFPGLIEMII